MKTQNTPIAGEGNSLREGVNTEEEFGVWPVGKIPAFALFQLVDMGTLGTFF